MDGSRSVADVNVEFNRQLEKRRAEAWLPERRKKTLAAVRRIAGVRALNELPRPAVKTVGTLQRPGYHVEKIILQTEADIWLPALFFSRSSSSGPAPVGW